MTDNDPSARTDEHGLTYYVRAPERPTEGNLAKHAWDELDRAGLFDRDSDYDGMLGRAVMDLVNVFVGQEHSGASAYIVSALFVDLVQFKPLSPLTDAADEWFQHDDSLWQSTRRADAFSADGGKTYYIVGKREEIFETEKSVRND